MLGLIELFLILYLPAMIANGSPVIIMRGRRGHPIDFGITLRDGNRLLGETKTLEGLFAGILAGFIIGILLGLIYIDTLGLTAVAFTPLASSVGAMLGDLVKSFFKRRLGMRSGQMLPLADQLDFYLGANLLLLICPYSLKPTIDVFIMGLLVIPALHVSTNVLAYRLGLKRVPY